LKTLVLAGTAEARAVVAMLASDPAFIIEASLAGATTAPTSLCVPTHRGGFGGEAGLASFCRDHGIDLILDVTHPYATTISGNAAQAAQRAGIACLHYQRPPWMPEQADRWQHFSSWQDMADAIPSNTKVFLAGGTRSVEIFERRTDITLVARALNLADKTPSPQTTFINALPGETIESECEILRSHNIQLICCKNSGGKSSFAKILAARECGIEVWMLNRKPAGSSLDGTAQKGMPSPQIHDTVDSIISAARQYAAARLDR
jgi:precorrin-6A/cobalt-precorrin-6A reductase